MAHCGKGYAVDLRGGAPPSRRSPASAEGRVRVTPPVQTLESLLASAQSGSPAGYFGISLPEHLRITQELEGPVKATKAGRGTANIRRARRGVRPCRGPSARRASGHLSRRRCRPGSRFRAVSPACCKDP